VKWNDAPNNNEINTISTPWVASADGGFTPHDRLNNPFPTGVIQPPGRNPSFQTTLLGKGINAVLPNSKNPYAQQWNLDIQRQLPDGTLLDVAYAGSKGVHLPAHTQNLNQLPDKDLALGNKLNDPVPNPFFGLITSGALADPTLWWRWNHSGELHVGQTDFRYGHLDGLARVGGRYSMGRF
jgi:hypothetical protein